jgi:hypothetical protein
MSIEKKIFFNKLFQNRENVSMSGSSLITRSTAAARVARHEEMLQTP